MDVNVIRLLHYLPLLSTVVAFIFLVYLVRRWKGSGDPALFWWMLGVAAYGLGTLTESVITVAGNSIFLNKFWYIVGALLGGYPLAQGTVYLLLKRKTADRWTAVTLSFVAITAILVILSPINESAFDPDKPSGAILGWSWVRLMTPLINGYAALFLVGGAAWSAVRFSRIPGQGRKATATALIAVGGLLPGIGGSMAKAGVVEGLYVGELIGLILIAMGTAAYSGRGESDESPSSETSAS
jgi:hypothetical protein